MTLRIETARLTLRPLTLDDTDHVTAYQSLEHAVRYVPFNPRTRDEVIAAITRQTPSEHLTTHGDFFILGMEHRQTGHIIGQVNIGLETTTPKTASIGYLTHPDHWRNGYTREAITALIDYAIEHEHIEQFTAVIVNRNDASLRLAESLGMQHTGTRADPDSPCTAGTPDMLTDWTMSAADWLNRT